MMQIFILSAELSSMVAQGKAEKAEKQYLRNIADVLDSCDTEQELEEGN